VPATVLAALPRLKKLSASHNLLSEIPDCSKNPELVELKLNSNAIEAAPEARAPSKRMKHLKLVDLGNNAIRTWKNIGLRQLPSLKNLNLRGNPLAPAPASLAAAEGERDSHDDPAPTAEEESARAMYRKEIKKRFPLLHVLDGRPCSTMHQERVARRREYRRPGTGERAEEQRKRKRALQQRIEDRRREKEQLIERLGKQGKIDVKSLKARKRRLKQRGARGAEPVADHAVADKKKAKGSVAPDADKPLLSAAERKLLRKELKKARRKRAAAEAHTGPSNETSEAHGPGADSVGPEDAKMSRVERRRIRAEAHRAAKALAAKAAKEAARAEAERPQRELKAKLKAEREKFLRVKGLAADSTADEAPSIVVAAPAADASPAPAAVPAAAEDEDAKRLARKRAKRDKKARKKAAARARADAEAVAKKRKAGGWQNAGAPSDTTDTKRQKIEAALAGARAKAADGVASGVVGSERIKKAPRAAVDFSALGTPTIGIGGGTSAW
jgi:hypothetical protein